MEVRKGHWIVTACHNLLSAADGDLMKDGKWTDIKVLVEGKWCKIKTLDQGLQREALKVKMKANLKQAEFLLPDNEFVLTERQSLDQVIPDVGHLVFDPVSVCVCVWWVDGWVCKCVSGFGAEGGGGGTEIPKILGRGERGALWECKCTESEREGVRYRIGSNYRWMKLLQLIFADWKPCVKI